MFLVTIFFYIVDLKCGPAQPQLVSLSKVHLELHKGNFNFFRYLSNKTNQEKVRSSSRKIAVNQFLSYQIRKLQRKPWNFLRTMLSEEMPKILILHKTDVIKLMTDSALTKVCFSFSRKSLTNRLPPQLRLKIDSTSCSALQVQHCLKAKQ